MEDVSQDWTLLSAAQAGGVTTVRATRALDTGDHQDWPLANLSNSQAVRYVVAMGSSDVHAYHGTHQRAYSEHNFFKAVPSKDELFSAVRADPSTITVELIATGFVVDARCTPYERAQAPLGVHTAAYHLRTFCAVGEDAGVTSYAEFCLDTSRWSAAHITAVEPTVDPNNIDIVHHFTVQGYAQSSSCSGSGVGFGAGWAPGGQGAIFPSNAGARVGSGGGFQSIRLQIHYDNKRGVSAVDNSGIRIHRTEALRVRDVEQFTLGDSSLAWNRTTAPASNFGGTPGGVGGREGGRSRRVGACAR